MPPTRVLTDELRNHLLLPRVARSPLARMFELIAEAVAGLYSVPSLGENLTPYQELGDPEFERIVADTVRLFGVEPVICVGDDVYGGVTAVLFPEPTVTIDRRFFAEPNLERRFFLGRAFDSLRGKYAPLTRFSDREKAEVAGLLSTLLRPTAERPEPAREFVSQLSEELSQALDRFVHAEAGDPMTWIQAVVKTQNRAGLLACNDFGVAARTLAALNGEALATTDDGAVPLGAIPGGADLVRFYISSDYDRLHHDLA